MLNISNRLRAQVLLSLSLSLCVLTNQGRHLCGSNRFSLLLQALQDWPITTLTTPIPITIYRPYDPEGAHIKPKRLTDWQGSGTPVDSTRILYYSNPLQAPLGRALPINVPIEPTERLFRFQRSTVEVRIDRTTRATSETSKRKPCRSYRVPLLLQSLATVSALARVPC